MKIFKKKLGGVIITSIKDNSSHLDLSSNRIKLNIENIYDRVKIFGFYLGLCLYLA